MEQGSGPPYGAPRRLTRSSRERMWAGVAGGLAEYFDLDPVVVRLMWVAATILTGGLAIPAYIVLWIIMPRDDRVVAPPASYNWEATSAQFREGVRSFTEEVRGMASDFGVTGSTRAPGSPPEPAAETASQGASSPTSAVGEPGVEPGAASATAEPGRAYESRADELRDPLLTPIVPPPPPPPMYARRDAPGRRHRTAGIVLIVLGLLFFAGQLGIYRWIAWHYVWPLVLVGVGFALLMRQNEWRR